MFKVSIPKKKADYIYRYMHVYPGIGIGISMGIIQCFEGNAEYDMPSQGILRVTVNW